MIFEHILYSCVEGGSGEALLEKEPYGIPVSHKAIPAGNDHKPVCILIRRKLVIGSGLLADLYRAIAYGAVVTVTICFMNLGSVIQCC